MRLDDAGVQAVVSALTMRGVSGQCPACMAARSVAKEIGLQPLIGGGAVPMALMICPRCGRTDAHGLRELGIALNIEPPAPAEPPPQRLDMERFQP